MYIRTKIVFHLQDIILLWKCQSEELGVTFMQKNLKYHFMLPEDFRTFSRSDVDCFHKYKINQGVMVGGRRPQVKDDLQWKMIFSGRQPSVEDDHRWKTPFGERRPLVEDDLRWKTTFSGRPPSVEDNLWQKITFCGR